jgi:hypothetical protein
MSAPGKPRVGQFLVLVLLVGIPFALAITAIPRLFAGVAAAPIERALISLTIGQPMPRAKYEMIAAALSNASTTDGDALITRAEAETRAAEDSRPDLLGARDSVLRGISESPGNPRGWTLLCELDAQFNLDQAARCMDTALYIGPFDWFVAGRRAVLASYLWPNLSRDSRKTSARRMKLLWANPSLRNIIWDVYNTKNGGEMLTAAFVGDRDTLATINRWLIHMQLCDAKCYPPAN